MKKQKIKVPAIWYRENLDSFKYQTQNEPKHLTQLQERYNAMKAGQPTNHDIKSGTNSLTLSLWVTEAKNQIGAGAKELKKFLEKYEPSAKVKPNYAGALAHLEKNRDKINKVTDIKSKWDYYNQMAFVEQKFFLPSEEGGYFNKITALFEQAGIESY